MAYLKKTIGFQQPVFSILFFNDFIANWTHVYVLKYIL